MSSALMSKHGAARQLAGSRPLASPSVQKAAPRLSARPGSRRPTCPCPSPAKGRGVGAHRVPRGGGCAAAVDKAPEAEGQGQASPEEVAEMDAIARQLVAKLQELGQGLDDVELENDDEDDIEIAELSLAVGSPAPTNKLPRSGRAKRKAGIRDRELPVEALPKVAIVGRPNVGKSALFNRICGKRMAIVYDEPGVTRDRLYTRAFWGDTEFVVVDTGGLLSSARDLPKEALNTQPDLITEKDLPSSIEWQAASGVFEADSVIFLVDGQEGLTGADHEVMDWLRQKHPGKPVVLAVNKCENPQKADLQASEFWELGTQPFPVSAISGTGTGEMMDALAGTLPPPKTKEEVDVEDEPLAVAIIGRPNVGKSSLINALCGEERTIVSNIAGTTRDAIDTILELEDGNKLKLIDTAGIRRRSKVASEGGAEALSVERAFAAIKRANIVVLVIDAGQGVTEQDFKLAEFTSQQGVGCLVVINKWDTVEKDTNTMNEYEADYRSQLRRVSWAPFVFTSAKTGQRVAKIVETICTVGDEYCKRVTTGLLNVVVQEAMGWRTPPSKKNGKRGRIFYATQAASRPPTFVMFVNDAECFPPEYRLYLEKQLRSNIGFEGTPLRIFFRGKPKANSEERRALGYGYN